MSRSSVPIYPNIVLLEGRIERKNHFPPRAHGGRSMLILTLKCQDSKDGRWNNYQDVVMFGESADFIQHYLPIGMLILIVGHIFRDRYRDKVSGGLRARTEIMGRRVYIGPFWNDGLREVLQSADPETVMTALPAWGEITDEEADAIMSEAEEPTEEPDDEGVDP